MSPQRGHYTAAVIGGTWIGVLAEVDRRRIPPSTHAGGYATHPRVRFVGLVENKPERIRDARAIFPSLPIFRSIDALGKAGMPDIVSVTTPIERRPDTLRTLARTGVQLILSEMPLARDFQTSKHIIQECEKRGVRLMANHLRRCNPLIRKVRREIEEGKIGDIVQVSFLYTGGLESWGSHGLDLIVHLVGMPCRVWAVQSHTDSGHTGDPNVDGWLELRNGVKVALLTTHFRDHRAFEIDLIGRRGRIRLTDLGFRAEFYSLGQSGRFSQPELVLKSTEISSESTFLPVVNHIVGVLDGKETPVLGANEALNVTRIIATMRESMHHGGAEIGIPAVTSGARATRQRR